MPTITTRDGTQIYYKDWGQGQPVVFSHGWPLTSDAFEDQMMFLASHGYRCIAHDRRGHGRSSQPWDGNDMDTYADDLADARRVSLTCATRSMSAIRPAAARSRATSAPRARTGSPRLVLIGAVPPMMAEDRGQSRRPADRGLRRHPQGRGRRSLAILQGPADALLRLQPAGRQGLRGPARFVLAAGHDGLGSRPSTTASRRSRRPTSPRT